MLHYVACVTRIAGNNPPLSCIATCPGFGRDDCWLFGRVCNLTYNRSMATVCCAGCGVDGVKVDVQGSVGMMGVELQGGPHLTHAYHTSLEQSIARNFPGNHAINCMGHSTENMYRYQDFSPSIST